jgi:putative addiction module CopG family antidote
MSIALPPDFEDFVNRQVAAGAFASQQEALATALGLLKRREKLLAQIDAGTDDIRAGRCVTYSESDRERFIEDLALPSKTGESPAK